MCKYVPPPSTKKRGSKSLTLFFKNWPITACGVCSDGAAGEAEGLDGVSTGGLGVQEEGEGGYVFGCNSSRNSQLYKPQPFPDPDPTFLAQVGGTPYILPIR